MHMISLIVVFASTSLLLAACGRDTSPQVPALDQEPVPVSDATHPDDGDHGLVISNPRARMSPMRAGVAAVYLDITNTSSRDDALVGAGVSETIAGVVELHETHRVDEATEEADDSGRMGGHGGMREDASESHAPMMRMREVERLDIPAGGSVELVPGGHHIMLLNLVADLEPGTTIELILHFEHAGDVPVAVEVRTDV